MHETKCETDTSELSDSCPCLLLERRRIENICISISLRMYQFWDLERREPWTLQVNAHDNCPSIIYLWSDKTTTRDARLKVHTRLIDNVITRAAFRRLLITVQVTMQYHVVHLKEVSRPSFPYFRKSSSITVVQFSECKKQIVTRIDFCCAKVTRYETIAKRHDMNLISCKSEASLVPGVASATTD